MRFGLLGTGYWAAETHAAALAAHPDAEFVGVWGRDRAKADALASRYGVAAYDDVDALFADVDAVAAALPPDVQAPLAERAAAAGKHLLLDKPVALTSVAADAVVAAAGKTGAASVVFFTRRFQPNIEAYLHGLVEAGDWHGARVEMMFSIFQPGSPYLDSSWRRQHGGLWDVGPHALSMILPVLGPVARVTAVDGPHATAHLLLTHRGGAVSSLTLTLDAPPAAMTKDCVFHGERGFATVPEGEGTSIDALVQAIGALVEAARSGVAHPCDVAFGAEVVAILEAAETARRTKASVNLG